VRSWIAVGSRAISGYRQNCLANHDAGSDRHLAALSRIIGGEQCLAHPTRV
jgi:hypothetical protein